MAKKTGKKNGGRVFSYRNIHTEIDAMRKKLVDALPSEPGAAREKFIAAIRNLDVAQIVLECNQSLSPFDYNITPCTHLSAMNKLIRSPKR